MSLIIELTDVNVREWTVNVEEQRVDVLYMLETEEGEGYKSGKAIFWAAMPTEPDPPPDNWYDLPSGYAQTLLNLTNDAESAIANRELYDGS
jgi:hypothetical protein